MHGHRKPARTPGQVIEPCWKQSGAASLPVRGAGLALHDRGTVGFSRRVGRDRPHSPCRRQKDNHTISDRERFEIGLLAVREKDAGTREVDSEDTPSTYVHGVSALCPRIDVRGLDVGDLTPESRDASLNEHGFGPRRCASLKGHRQQKWEKNSRFVHRPDSSTSGRFGQYANRPSTVRQSGPARRSHPPAKRRLKSRQRAGSG